MLRRARRARSGPDGELVVSAGNHDHGLVAGWIDARLQTEPPGFLGLEQRDRAARRPARSPRALAERARARARCGSPTRACGCATTSTRIHGHYSDLHTTVPTFERLAAGAMARWVVHAARATARRPTTTRPSLAPLYAWMHALTQRSEHAACSARARARRRAPGSRWPASARRRRPLRAARARRRLRGRGRGASTRPASARSTATSRRRRCAAAACAGMREVLRAARRSRRRYVIWGHSHRSGPWPRDDPRSGRTPAGTRLLNTGSWVYQPHFLADAAERARPTGRARRCCVEDERPAAARRACWATAGTTELGATPGVKQVAWHVDARRRPRARARRAVWRRVLEQRDAARARRSRRARAVRPRSSPAPSTHGPHAARLVRAGVGAGLVGGLGRRAARPARPRGAAGAQRLALDAEQRLDLALGLGVGALAVVHRVQRAGRGPTGSARASPRCRRRPRSRAARRSPPGTRSRAARRRARTSSSVARRREAAGVDADRPAGRRPRSARARPSGRAACAAS